MRRKLINEALKAYPEFTEEQFWRYVNNSLDLTLEERQALAKKIDLQYRFCDEPIFKMSEKEFAKLDAWNKRVQRALEYSRADPKFAKEELKKLGFSQINIRLMVWENPFKKN